MFKKLHRRLALTNVMILTCFLIIFSYALVGFFSTALDRSTQNSLYNRAIQLINVSQQRNSFDFIILDSSIITDENILQGASDVHYIIWDDNRRLAALNFVDSEMIGELFENAKATFNSEDGLFQNLKIKGEKYKLYSQYYELPSGRGGVIQVLQSREIDNYVLRQLFIVILLIGSVSTVILIVISSYMARKSLKPVKESYDRQKEFIADASHELRTPLTIMKTNLELLAMKENETIEENKQWLDNIYSETETMTKLVQDLLVLAQGDNNEIKIKMEIVNLSIIVQRIVDKFALLAKENDIELKSVIADEVLVKGNENRLEQLLVILVDNAMKYSREGSTILISLMTTAEKAYLSVKDSGIGISDEDKEKIFARFYRVDKVRSREQGGVGLGLSIAKWIVDEHKGTIELNSELNEGSEFTVCFDTKNKMMYR